MLKNLINIFSPMLISMSPIKKYLEAYSRKSFRILYYHYVGNNVPDYYFKGKGITHSEFLRQVEYFRNRYEIISLKEAIERTEEKQSLQNCLTITTDDGFSSNYHTIAPILDEFNLTAEFFITTNFINNADLMWRNKLCAITNNCDSSEIKSIMIELSRIYDIPQSKNNIQGGLINWSNSWDMNYKDRFAKKAWDLSSLEPLDAYLDKHKPYMTEFQIQELHSAGFGISSHSLSHPYFDKLDWNSFEKEILDSVEVLRNIIGEESYSFSYPFGKRASPAFERRLIESNPHISSILGINNLNENSINPYAWERDLQEDAWNMSQFRFLILPILRKFI